MENKWIKLSVHCNCVCAKSQIWRGAKNRSGEVPIVESGKVPKVESGKVPRVESGEVPKINLARCTKLNLASKELIDGVDGALLKVLAEASVVDWCDWAGCWGLVGVG